MVEEDDAGMVCRDIPDDMLQRKVIQEDAQLGDLHAAVAGKGRFVHRQREGKNAGISPHKGIQQARHPPVRQVDVIQCVTVDRNHNPRVDVDILAEGEVVLTLQVFHGVMY